MLDYFTLETLIVMIYYTELKNRINELYIEYTQLPFYCSKLIKDVLTKGVFTAMHNEDLVRRIQGTTLELLGATYIVGSSHLFVGTILQATGGIAIIGWIALSALGMVIGYDLTKVGSNFILEATYEKISALIKKSPLDIELTPDDTANIRHRAPTEKDRWLLHKSKIFLAQAKGTVLLYSTVDFASRILLRINAPNKIDAGIWKLIEAL